MVRKESVRDEESPPLEPREHEVEHEGEDEGWTLDLQEMSKIKEATKKSGEFSEESQPGSMECFPLKRR
jgi:hypothetical protein